MGAGVGAMEANTWCTRSHDGHWGEEGWVGVAQAWQCREGERRGQWAPARSFWGGGEEVGGVSGLEDGRNQLEGLNGGTGGMATWWIVWAQEMECGGRAAGTGPALGSGL